MNSDVMTLLHCLLSSTHKIEMWSDFECYICIIFQKKTFKICVQPLNLSVLHLHISSSLKSPAFQVCYSTLADCSRFLTQFQFNFVYELFYVLFCLPKGLCPFILFPSFVSQFVHFRFYLI